jgi:cardiolipin synthase
MVADWLSRGFYGRLLRAVYGFTSTEGDGAREDRDDRRPVVDIGTANIDRLSLLGNYEINMEVFSADVAKQMEEIFASTRPTPSS